jgi:quercetin dioxygenase-like cupin family protein
MGPDPAFNRIQLGAPSLPPADRFGHLRCALGRKCELVRMRPSASWVFSHFALVACTLSPPQSPMHERDAQPAMAAASGVTRADGGKGLIDYRIIPLRQMSGDVEILYGDPDVVGQPFVMRIRELPGAVVPPHSHPVDEHITVVEGTWYFGLGERFDAAALSELRAGSYAFAPKGSWMFGYAPDGATVQVHGVGRFQIHWHDGVRTLNDSDARSTFRLKRGDLVTSPRGAGLIVEGYTSGKLIQYEIEASNGSRFMAHEHELRVQ